MNDNIIPGLENNPGTPDPDFIVGTGGNDTLFGLGGNDTLDGLGGNDELFGGTGNDLLDGWTGDDELFGEAGNDTLLGFDGDDLLDGGTGDDELFGEAGNDTLLGFDGDDLLDGFGFGPSEFDTLSGGSGADTFVLGNSFEAYYQGVGFATITDFNFAEGDKFQVFGSASDYTLTPFGNGIDINFQGDLIGFVENTTDVILSEDFIFVG